VREVHDDHAALVARLRDAVTDGPRQVRGVAVGRGPVPLVAEEPNAFGALPRDQPVLVDERRECQRTALSGSTYPDGPRR
jgi:hypothetical protein